MDAANYNKRPKRFSWPGQPCIRTEGKRKKGPQPSTSVRVKSQQTMIAEVKHQGHTSHVCRQRTHEHASDTKTLPPRAANIMWPARPNAKRSASKVKHPNSRSLRYKCYCHRSKSTNKLQQLQHQYGKPKIARFLKAHKL